MEKLKKAIILVTIVIVIIVGLITGNIYEQKPILSEYQTALDRQYNAMDNFESIKYKVKLERADSYANTRYNARIRIMGVTNDSYLDDEDKLSLASSLRYCVPTDFKTSTGIRVSVNFDEIVVYINGDSILPESKYKSYSSDESDSEESDYTKNTDYNDYSHSDSSNSRNGYDMPNESDASFSDYVKRVDPELYDSMEDEYDSMKEDYED